MSYQLLIAVALWCGQVDNSGRSIAKTREWVNQCRARIVECEEKKIQGLSGNSKEDCFLKEKL